jgi:hypothetical protein
MSLPDGVAAAAGEEGSAGLDSTDLSSSNLPPRPGKAARVLLFFGYFFGLAIGIPALTVALVQAKYGLIDGPPSVPPDVVGEQIKSITKYGIFVWAGMQFFIFGRVASWVTAVPAVAGVAPIARDALMQRLLSLNRQDIPFAVKRGHRDNELVIDWRYADAKWLDLMRLHGMSKGYRLVLRFDDGAHNVRAQDRYASFDWSTGPNFVSLNWNVSLGITFYEYRHERVFGLQFKDGKPTFDLSYAYTFDLNELKQPMIEIVRHAGWNFRPVITFFRPIGG